jgi:hypothetical protein
MKIAYVVRFVNKHGPHRQEEFEDVEGVIRIRISKNRQHNGQKNKHTYKTKDRVT